MTSDTSDEKEAGTTMAEDSPPKNTSRFSNLEALGDGRYYLDACGYACPYPEVLTKRAIEALSPGDILEAATDNVPSFETMPAAAEKLGCDVLKTINVDETVRKFIIEIKGSQ